jgi:hypothetical protein
MTKRRWILGSCWWIGEEKQRKKPPFWYYHSFTKFYPMARKSIVCLPFKQILFCFFSKTFSQDNNQTRFKTWWKLNSNEPTFLEKQKILGAKLTFQNNKNKTRKWKNTLRRYLDTFLYFVLQNIPFFQGHTVNWSCKINLKLTERKSVYILYQRHDLF